MKLIPESFSQDNLSAESIIRFLILLATTAVLTAVMTPVISDSYWSLLSPGSFSAGSEAPRSLQAPREYRLQDHAATAQRKDAAAANLKKIFRHNDLENNLSQGRLGELFSSLKEFAAVSDDGDGNSTKIVLNSEQRGAFERQARIDLIGKDWDVILNRKWWGEIENSLSALVDPYLERGIVANRELIDSAISKSGVILLHSSDGSEQELFSSNDLITYDKARQLFSSAVRRKELAGQANLKELIKKLGLMLIEPNVTLDNEETLRRAASLQETIEPVVYTIKRGQFILRAGEIISSDKQQILEQIRSQHSTFDVIKSVIGYFLLATLIVTTVFLFTINIWPSFKPDARDLLIIGCILICSFLLMKGVRVLGDALVFSYPDISSNAFLLIAPVAMGGILLEVVLGAPAVFLFTMAFALLTGVFMEEAWLFLLLVIMGNIVGAVSVQHCPRRSQFLVAGFRVALINLVILLGFVLLEPQSSVSDNALKLLCGTAAGLLSGFLAAALSPLAEIAGSYITDMKLLELASLDRPLLRELSVQAPGTWNHSVVMGQMAEAAGKAIGANSLLSRVGAYYHDVGKMKNPPYFIENQTSRDNRHDKLAPSMSALIIKAHVKNGVELAEQHNLPRPLIEFISQHHGTSLIEFFYDKALKEAEDDEAVDESHYRYAGPKPQTKESGILMLADGVEASSRTLSDPTPAKIQGLVQKMINKIFAGGELDESELTLKELHLIAKEFTRVLTGIHHRRIEYAEPAGKEREEESSETGKQDSKVDLRVVTPTPKSKEKRKEGEVNGSRRSGEKGAGKNSGESAEDRSAKGASKDTLKRLGIKKV